MANSLHLDPQGPDWPLGFVKVTTPGTPISIMTNVDSASVNAPETGAGPGPSASDEYTRAAQQIIFQAFKAGGATRLANNTGNIYIVRKPTAGAGGVTDVGNIVAVLTPGQTFILGSSSLVRNVFSPYRYLIDADTANDGAEVTLIMQ